MQLALVSETYAPEVNGVALTVQSLLQQLVAQGHRVCLSCPRPPVDPDERSFVHQQTPGRSLPWYPDLRFGWPAGRRLESLWREARVQGVYVATEGPLGDSALRAARRLGLPVVTGFHTRFDEFLAHYGLGLLKPLGLRYLRAFHDRADATLVPTRELQAFLQARGFSRVELLRRAVDTALFTPQRRSAALRAKLGVADSQLLVLAVGRIAPEKNFALAFAAFRAIRQRHPTARLVVVGDGPARAALMREMPEAVWTGMLSHAELAAHYASADLYLMPSLTETFGNVTLEAMACGVDTLAFDYGAAREHLIDSENGWSVPFGDAAAYVRRAEAAADAVAGGRRLGPAARQTLLPLSPARVAADLVELLVRLGARSERLAASTPLNGVLGESP
ncbi:MAG: glycosyltransferase family 1 protein [Xanthomonadales bacterium]|jgi:glycosyltransferase involved in cell wall biosynthesis|nr:glycosyltransferase family 1 protein [Xanthomonadales bacterium]